MGSVVLFHLVTESTQNFVVFTHKWCCFIEEEQAFLYLKGNKIIQIKMNIQLCCISVTVQLYIADVMLIKCYSNALTLPVRLKGEEDSEYAFFGLGYTKYYLTVFLNQLGNTENSHSSRCHTLGVGVAGFRCD